MAQRLLNGNASGSGPLLISPNHAILTIWSISSVTPVNTEGILKAEDKSNVVLLVYPPLPSGCPFRVLLIHFLRPARHYPRFWIRHTVIFCSNRKGPASMDCRKGLPGGRRHLSGRGAQRHFLRLPGHRRHVLQPSDRRSTQRHRLSKQAVHCRGVFSSTDAFPARSS